MQKQYLQCKIVREQDGDLTIVASDETLDRYGEVVPLDAWDLRNYKKNPVLLVDHDYKVANIVGRAKNLKVGDKAFTFTPEFHDITDLAKQVSEMVKTDFAPAVSVGFLPHGPKKDGDKGSNELLEISFVALGANPNALAMAMKSVNAEQETEIKEWMEIKRFEADEDIAEVLRQKAELLVEMAMLKEGRVLSGKNRELITNCSSALKQASALLEELLLATEPNKGKEDGEHKSREPKMEHGNRVPAKRGGNSVARALQDINRISRDVITELKGGARS